MNRTSFTSAYSGSWNVIIIIMSRKDKMMGTLPGNKRQGRPQKQWLNDLTEWAELTMLELVRSAEDSNADKVCSL